MARARSAGLRRWGSVEARNERSGEGKERRAATVGIDPTKPGVIFTATTEAKSPGILRGEARDTTSSWFDGCPAAPSAAPMRKV